jgi:hypothetical protein
LSGFPGADSIDTAVEFLLQRVTIEKEDSAEGLVLGRGGDMLIHGEVSEEGFDFGGAHFAGVALVVEADEACDPVDVGLLSAGRVVLKTDGLTKSIEQLARTLGHGLPPVEISSRLCYTPVAGALYVAFIMPCLPSHGKCGPVH